MGDWRFDATDWPDPAAMMRELNLVDDGTPIPSDNVVPIRRRPKPPRPPTADMPTELEIDAARFHVFLQIRARIAHGADRHRRRDVIHRDGERQRHSAAVVYTPRGPVVVVALTYRPGLTRAAAAAFGGRLIRIAEAAP